MLLTFITIAKNLKELREILNKKKNSKKNKIIAEAN